MVARQFLLVLALIPFSLSVYAQGGHHAQSEEWQPGPFSIQVEGGLTNGASASMHGTAAEFQTEVQKDYNNSVYPFGDASTTGYHAGVRLSYRIVKPDLSLYLAGRLVGLTTTQPSQGSSNTQDSAVLAVGTISLGAKYGYTLLPGLEAFGRAGINVSRLGGSLVFSVPQYSGSVNLYNGNRGGFEIGAGIDWQPFSILLLSIYADYSDINVIGKEYIAPGSSPPQFLFIRDINDAANPNNPSDSPRTIDFLLLGVSLGFRF